MNEDIKAFLADNYENIGQIERDIVDLEQNPTDKDLLVRIYRSLHTIKGNCGFMAFGKLKALTHSGENLLSRVRDGELILNTDIINALLQLVDAIQQSCICIDATGQESDFDHSELIERLNDLQHGTHQHKLSIIALNLENVADSLSTPPSVPSNSTQTLDLTKIPIYDIGGHKNGKCNGEEPATPLAAAQTVPSIRVDINLLDKLMNLVGELVLVRNHILQFNFIQDEAGFEAASQHLNISISLNLIKWELAWILTIARNRKIFVFLNKQYESQATSRYSVQKLIKLYVINSTINHIKKLISI